MPTASGGSAPFLVAFSTSSMITTPRRSGTEADQPQSRLPPRTPWAIAEISAACGAASAFGRSRRALEAERVLNRSRIGGMTTAPKITPRTSATCCRHGVASTSWPVFRS